MSRVFSIVLCLLPATACTFEGASGVGADASTDSATDSQADDAATDGSTTACAPARSDLLAHWRFDALPSTNLVGDSDAVSDGDDSLTLGLIEGPSPECGMALEIPAGSTGGTLRYARIGEDDDFDQLRALDMYVREPAGIAVPVSVLGRDAVGAGPGHIFVFLVKAEETNRPLIAVRTQNGGVSSYRCAEVPPPGTWFHFAMNMTDTSFNLYVDGVLRSEPSTTLIDVFGSPRPCDLGPAREPLASDRDFTLGVSEPNGDPSMPFPLGAIDNVRFFSSAQDFASQ